MKMRIPDGSRLLLIVAMAALTVAPFTSEAADGPLVNCNEVRESDRCACNDRVLRALTAIRFGAVDPEMVSTAPATANPIAILQDRQHRLRTFYAPQCDRPDPKHLPIAEGPTTKKPFGLHFEDYQFRPFRTECIIPTTDPIPSDCLPLSAGNTSPEELLVGRWEGWQTLFGSKPSPISLHILALEGQGRFVKACSDQGMVFGRVTRGYLEVPRTDSMGRSLSLRLWRGSPPNSRDLEGVTLIEARPRETFVAGLVSLSRPVKFDWTTPPSSYFCQDRDLEEQKRVFKEIHKDE